MREYTSYGKRDGNQVTHWGVTFDADKPITGVISNNTPEWLSDAMFEGNAIDLAWEDHLLECKGQCNGCHCTHDNGESNCDCWNKEEHKYDPIDDCHDHCGPQEHGTILIGSWIKVDGQYEPDTSGEYAAIVGETYTQVVWSKYTKKCALCSPCYPGSADLDNEGEFVAYDLPQDMYGEKL